MADKEALAAAAAMLANADKEVLATIPPLLITATEALKACKTSLDAAKADLTPQYGPEGAVRSQVTGAINAVDSYVRQMEGLRTNVETTLAQYTNSAAPSGNAP